MPMWVVDKGSTSGGVKFTCLGCLPPPASSGRAAGRCWLDEKPAGVERMVLTIVRGPYHGAAGLAARSVRRLAAARDALQAISKVKMGGRSVL